MSLSAATKEYVSTTAMQIRHSALLLKSEKNA